MLEGYELGFDTTLLNMDRPQQILKHKQEWQKKTKITENALTHENHGSPQTPNRITIVGGIKQESSRQWPLALLRPQTAIELLTQSLTLFPPLVLEATPDCKFLTMIHHLYT